MLSITANKSKQPTAALQIEAARDLRRIMDSAGSQFTQDELSANVLTFGLESMAEEVRMSTLDTINGLKSQAIAGSPALMELLNRSAAHLQGDARESAIDFGLEQMALTLLQGSTKAGLDIWHTVGTGNVSVRAGEVLVGEQSLSEAYGFESFEPTKTQSYLYATAVANAQASIPGQFEEVWFPAVTVAAGQDAYRLSVTIPKILTTKARGITAGNGTYTLNKQSLLQAVSKPSILNSAVTTLYPNADDTAIATFLAPVADVPNISTPLNGANVNTRPFLASKAVDVIAASKFDSILGNNTYDETEALDPAMNVGTLYFRVGVDVAGTVYTAIFKTDVSGQAGAWLTQKSQGRVQGYQTVFSPLVFAKFDPVGARADNFVASGVTGTRVAYNTIVGYIQSALGLQTTESVTLAATFDVSADGDTEEGKYMLAFTTATGSIKGYTKADGSAIAYSGNAITITPLYHLPNLRRTNSNIRSNGTLVDINTTVNYVFPVTLSSPVTSQSPINVNTGANLEYLAKTYRLRVNGNCFTAITDLEKSLSVLKSANLGPASSLLAPWAGVGFIAPTLISDTIDVAQETITLNSKDNIENLSGALTSLLSTMANDLVTRSGYLAALQLTTHDLDSFEFIILADPKIAPYIMKDGDVRTFGDGRKYRITTNNNDDLKNKIYMSMRLTGNYDEIHPLNFGVKLVAPAMTYEVMVPRNGRLSNELQYIGKTNPYVLLPALAVLTVQNMDSVFATTVSN